MRRATKPGLPQRLPRAVVALCWALAAMHWRTSARPHRGQLVGGGATYAGLRVLTGISSRQQLHRLVGEAARARVVTRAEVVVDGVTRPVVMLRRSTLEQLEALWTG